MIKSVENMQFRAPKVTCCQSKSQKKNSSAEADQRLSATAQEFKLPILGGLLWLSPLTYQLVTQAAVLVFAVLVVKYLSVIARK